MTGLAACPTEAFRVLKGFSGTCLLRASCRAPTLLIPPPPCHAQHWGLTSAEQVL